MSLLDIPSFNYKDEHKTWNSSRRKPERKTTRRETKITGAVTKYLPCQECEGKKTQHVTTAQPKHNTFSSQKKNRPEDVSFPGWIVRFWFAGHLTDALLALQSVNIMGPWLDCEIVRQKLARWMNENEKQSIPINEDSRPRSCLVIDPSFTLVVVMSILSHCHKCHRNKMWQSRAF